MNRKSYTLELTNHDQIKLASRRKTKKLDLKDIKRIYLKSEMIVFKVRTNQEFVLQEIELCNKAQALTLFNLLIRHLNGKRPVTS